MESILYGFPPAPRAPDSIVVSAPTYSGSTEVLQFSPQNTVTDASQQSVIFQWQYSVNGGTAWLGPDGTGNTFYSTPEFQPPAFSSGTMMARCRTKVIGTNNVSPTWVVSANTTYVAPPTATPGTNGHSPNTTTTASYTLATSSATVNVADTAAFAVNEVVIFTSGANRFYARLSAVGAGSLTFTWLQLPGDAAAATVFAIGTTVAVAGEQGNAGTNGAAGVVGPAGASAPNAAPTSKPIYGVPINTSLALASSLVGWWAFNEGSGTTIHDLSASGLNLAAVNTPTWGTDTFGRILTTNGSNQYIGATGLSYALTAGLTIVARVKITSPSTAFNTDIVRLENAAPTQYALLRWSQGHGDLLQGVSDGTTTTLTTGAASSNNTYENSYHLFALRYIKGTGVVAYKIDGTTVLTATATAATSLSALTLVGIMQSDQSTTGCAAGSIDVVGVWNRDLTDTELSTLLTSPYTLWTANGLTAYFPTTTTTYTDLGEIRVFVNANGGAVTVTIPTALSRAFPVTVTKTDSSANAVTVAAASGQTINGAASVSITARYATRVVVPDGTASFYVASSYL